MLIILHRLAQKGNIKPLKEKAGKAKHAERIATYIQENYMRELDLDFIANELSFSKSYLSHLFKELSGFTVMEYVMSCLLTQVNYFIEMEIEKKLNKIEF